MTIEFDEICNRWKKHPLENYGRDKKIYEQMFLVSPPWRECDVARYHGISSSRVHQIKFKIKMTIKHIIDKK